MELARAELDDGAERTSSLLPADNARHDQDSFVLRQGEDLRPHAHFEEEQQESWHQVCFRSFFLAVPKVSERCSQCFTKNYVTVMC